MSHFFKLLLLWFSAGFWMGVVPVFAQHQSFEAEFQAQSFPLEFLPNWYGNDVRSTSARIFQVSGLGRSGSKALAVQPIGTFNAKIWIRLNPAEFQNPEAVFYAKSIQNGSGTRPALVFFSWGESLTGVFPSPVQIGNDNEFANESQNFRRYNLTIPEELKTVQEAFLIFEIRYGLGTGSAARWILDDFEFGDVVKDQTPPQISSVKGYNENELLIRFSEKIDPVFSSFPLTYELDGKNPEKAELKQDSLLVLSFSERLQTGKEHRLLLRQIPDLEGNFLQDTTVLFTFFDPTAIPEKGLVLNELMPAPKADLDLPNVEYIELFHAGEFEFRLQGLQLSNSRSAVVLEELWLKPGEFLILAPETQAKLMENYGKVLPVKNWPTLLNSGDQITLKSSKGTAIDQISFTTASWGGSDFANGGYSLEVPNPDFLCSNSMLLKSSTDPARGTPGAQNSVFSNDQSSGSIGVERAYFLDSIRISVIFSQPVLQDLTLGNLDFSPNPDPESFLFLSEKELQVSLKSPAISNLPYQLRIFGIKDCFGNVIPEQIVTLVVSERPKAGELIINEVLFNPRTGDPKFVELKNTSQKYLRLEGLALANLNSSELPDQIRVFGARGLLMAPESYLAITTEVNALKLAYPQSSQGEFLQIASLPSYPIAGGTVVLLSAEKEKMESFTYREKLHHPLLRDPKGVSLERISDKSPAALNSNWQSASGNEGFATPGRKNSQAISGEFESEWIRIEPEVFDPEGSSGPTFASIGYQLDQSGWVGTFRIYSAAGQLIQTLAQNQILGNSGLLTWTGTDSTGKMVRAGYYVLVVELYEPNGRAKVLKKTIVVATRL